MIDGEAYWDGGLVSNTPLQYLIDNHRHEQDMYVFQIDLFSAKGEMPRTILEVAEREKEIRYSSRTRFNTSTARQILLLRKAATRLSQKLPMELRDDPDLKVLNGIPPEGAISIVHLINRPSEYDTQSMDVEFSRLSMIEHWSAGKNDVMKTLRSAAWQHRSRPRNGIAIYDLTKTVGKTEDAHEYC